MNSNKIIKLKTIDSTHKWAIRSIENGTAFECGIIADEQTDGVGRCERVWKSHIGNLHSSIIKKITDNTDICKLSLTTACAVHQTIRNLLSSDKKNDLYLHWPNDIYYQNKKLSGILLAVINDWVVISIGINIYSVSLPNTTGLDKIVDNLDISSYQLFVSVLDQLKSWLNLLKINSFFDIKQYWLQNMIGMNSEVTLKNGKDSIVGTIKGLDDLGRLILGKEEKELFISSGDMFINENQIMVNYG